MNSKLKLSEERSPPLTLEAQTGNRSSLSAYDISAFRRNIDSSRFGVSCQVLDMDRDAGQAVKNNLIVSSLISVRGIGAAYRVNFSVSMCAFNKYIASGVPKF
jgi:hypothetical protein